jgi:hypothetical protein
MIIVMMTMLATGVLTGVALITVLRVAVVLIPIVSTAIRRERLFGG